MAEAKSVQPFADRSAMHGHAVNRGQLRADLVQRQVGLGHQPIPHPICIRRQFAIAAVALPLRHQPTAFTLQDHHVIHEFRRNPEVPRCLTMSVTLLNKGDNPAAKFHRMWSAHPIPLHLLKVRESHIAR